MKNLLIKLQNIYYKYFGKIEYIVTIVNVSLSIKTYSLYSLKDVDDFVISINNETYSDIQKIEKIRRFNFIYDKEVIHSPLHFCTKDITEMKNCNNYDYSFLKKHDSLDNVKLVSSKKYKV